MFRFTIRDLLWLVTGIAIAFAILGSWWRHEYATWNRQRAIMQQQRAALQANMEAQTARATVAERNLKGIHQDLQDPTVIREIAIAAKIEQQFREQKARQPNP